MRFPALPMEEAGVHKLAADQGSREQRIRGGRSVWNHEFHPWSACRQSDYDSKWILGTGGLGMTTITQSLELRARTRTSFINT